jgi:hypothetical protein
MIDLPDESQLLAQTTQGSLPLDLGLRDIFCRWRRGPIDEYYRTPLGVALIHIRAGFHRRGNAARSCRLMRYDQRAAARFNLQYDVRRQNAAFGFLKGELVFGRLIGSFAGIGAPLLGPW